MSVTSRACRSCPATSPSSLPADRRLSVCRCRSSKSRSTTCTTCCGHPPESSREDPRSILVRHVRHARFPRDLLANPRKDVTRMLRGELLPWNLSFSYDLTDVELMSWRCILRFADRSNLSHSHANGFSIHPTPHNSPRRPNYRPWRDLAVSLSMSVQGLGVVVACPSV